MAEDTIPTTEKAAPEKAAPATPGLTATLIYGTTYYLGNKRFEAGKPVAITANEADMLRDKSVARTVIDGDKRETLETKRFKIEGEAAAGRTRSR